MNSTIALFIISIIAVPILISTCTKGVDAKLRKREPPIRKKDPPPRLGSLPPSKPITDTSSSETAVQQPPHPANRSDWGNISQEARIKRIILLDNEFYDKSSRPVKEDSRNVTVQIGISLYHIAAMEEKYQTITFLLAVRLKWNDEYLRWNPDDFKNVDHIHMPSDSIWKPDIRIANSVDYEAEPVETNVIIYSTGDVLWMSPHAAKIYCNLDMRNFPFDSQMCDIKFFSWTYHGFQVDLTAEPGNTSYFANENQEWTVRRITSQRNVAIYACCVEPFPLISFTVNMKRGAMFHIFNLIFPCVLIYSVALLGFFLPIQSIEKINLEVTVLLAQVVFLQVIGETMPANPEKLPLLGWLYAATMVLVSIELVSAVAVTNIYYKGKEGETVPIWLYKILFWGKLNELCPHCKRPTLRLYRHDEDEPTVKNAAITFSNAVSHGLYENFNGLLNGEALDYSEQPKKQMSSTSLTDLMSEFPAPPANKSFDDSSKRRYQPHQRVRSEKKPANKLRRASFGTATLTSSPSYMPRSRRHHFYLAGVAEDGEVPTRTHEGRHDYFYGINSPSAAGLSKIKSRQSMQAMNSSDADFGEHNAGPAPTKWFQTRDGCMHIQISWREAAERLDGYLFWVFVVVSTVVFVALISSAQEKEKQ